MPAIRNQKVHKAADFPKQYLPHRMNPVASQTGLVCFSCTPGYKHQLVKVISFCSAKAGTVTAVVKVGGRTAASVVFTAATEVNNALSTTLANIRGAATDAITIEYTTDGAGGLTDGEIIIVLRAWPLSGDLGPV